MAQANIFFYIGKKKNTDLLNLNLYARIYPMSLYVIRVSILGSSPFLPRLREVK
jgi:hypothetical protein